MRDDYQKLLNLIDWFKSTELVETDPQRLVSFSTGKICIDETVNCYLSDDLGMKMLESIDGGNLTSRVSLKLKCKNFDVSKKLLKVNNKEVILAPYLIFQRLPISAERKLTLDGSLGCELTIQPASLFDIEHFMKDSHKNHKSKLGKFLKEKFNSEDSCSVSSLVMDGRWLIHQIPL